MLTHAPLQAVTKYTVQARQHTAAGSQLPQTAAIPAPTADCVLEINIRDAFVAPKGRLLLAADYSQVELRLLAHCSKDPALCSILRQAGAAGDAFTAIAGKWLSIWATGVSSCLNGLTSVHQQLSEEYYLTSARSSCVNAFISQKV